MLRVTLTRAVDRESCILGVLSLPDLELLTLERPWVNNLPQQSCIPTGEYLVELLPSPKFKRSLFELVDVPGRAEIKFHAGTTVKDTNGCILLGQRFGRHTDRPAVLESVIALNKMHSALMGVQQFVLKVRSL